MSTDQKPYERERVLIGRWWLADHPSHVVGATLTFSADGGGTLLVSGSLSEVLRGPGEDRPDVDLYGLRTTIYGVTTENERVTVLAPQFAGRRDSYRPRDDEHTLYRETWRCDDVFVGEHAPGDALSHVDAAFVQTSNLQAWVAEPVPMWDLDTPRERGVRRMMVTVPDPLVADFVDGRVLLAWGGPEWWGPDGISLSVTAGWRLEPLEPLSFDTLRTEWISPLLDLVTAATGLPDTVHSISVGYRLDGSGAGEGGVREFGELLTTRLPPPPTVSQPVPHADRQLIEFSWVKANFQTFVSSWLRLYRDIPWVMKEYFSGYAPTSDTEASFVSTVKSLEQWHAERIGGKTLAPATFDDALARIRQGLTSEQWAALKDRLGHADEPSLKRRLTELVSEVGHPLGPFLSSKVLRRIVDHRNGLTHGFGGRPGAFREDEMWWALETVRLSFISLLLRECGVSDEDRYLMIWRSEVGQIITQSPHNPLRPAN